MRSVYNIRQVDGPEWGAPCGEANLLWVSAPSLESIERFVEAMGITLQCDIEPLWSSTITRSIERTGMCGSLDAWITDDESTAFITHPESRIVDLRRQV